MVATKEQERQALQQIRKIVEDLGEDSYIGMAFEGVWEIAEENIDNDFGISCQSYIDLLREEEAKNARLLESYGAKDRCLKERIKELECELARKESIISEQEMQFEDLEKSYETALRVADSNKNDKLYFADLLDQRNLEIVKLKAKLFDLMFQGN